MTREQLLEAACEVFRDIFDDESLVIADATVADDIEDWDSLENINLVLALEQRFGVQFTMDEVTSMKCVGDMIDILLERGKL